MPFPDIPILSMIPKSVKRFPDKIVLKRES